MDKPINNENQATPIGDDWAAFSSKPAGDAETRQEPGPRETAGQDAPSPEAEAAQAAFHQELLRARAQLAEAGERLRRLEEQARSQGIDTAHRPYAFATGQTQSVAARDEAESRDEAMTAQAGGLAEETAAESGNATRLFGEEIPEGDTYVAPGENRLKEDRKNKKAVAGTGHNALFQSLATAGPLVVALMLALLVWMSAYLGDLATPDEVLTLQVVSGMDGFAVLPHTADKVLLPVYAWFAHLTSLIPLPFMDRLYGPLTSYLGALVCLFGLGFFSASLRLGKNVTFAASLMMLGLPVFIGTSNLVGPVAFSCGLSLLAMGLLCRAFMASFDMIGMVAGAIIAALAALSGGIYYGLVPMLSGLLFALWRGGNRLRNTDSVAGVVAFVVVLLAWYAAILLGSDVDSSTAFKAFLAVNGVPGITDGIIASLIAFVPFVAIVISVSWPRAIAHAASGLKASRHESAIACPWIALVLAIALLALSANLLDFLLAVCIMAVLGANSLMKLGTMGVKFFNILVCLVLVVTSVLALGFTLPFVGDLLYTFLGTIFTNLPTHLLPESTESVMNDVRAMNFVATIVLPLLPLVAAAIILHVAWRSSTAAAPLLVTVVSIIVVAQVFAFTFAPYMAGQPAFRFSATSSVYVPEARALPFGAPETLSEEAAPSAEPAPADEAKEPDAAEPASAPAEPETDEEPAPAEPETPAASEEAAPEAAPAEDAAGVEPAEAPAEAEAPAAPEDAAEEGADAGPEESAPAEAPADEAPADEASQDATDEASAEQAAETHEDAAN